MFQNARMGRAQRIIEKEYATLNLQEVNAFVEKSINEIKTAKANGTKSLRINIPAEKLSNVAFYNVAFDGIYKEVKNTVYYMFHDGYKGYTVWLENVLK